MRLPRWAVPATAVLAQLALAPGVSACAVCLGDPSSPLTWGLSKGVVFLIGMVAVVYASVAAFIVVAWRRRSARLRRDGAGAPLHPVTLTVETGKVARG